MLSFLKIPLYPIAFTVYTTGLVLETIIKLPTILSNYYEKQEFLNSPHIYVDFNSYTKFTGIHINHNEYKDYIFVIKDNKFVKAQLMINKNTGKMAYVIDNMFVCDNDTYKLTT